MSSESSRFTFHRKMSKPVDQTDITSVFSECEEMDMAEQAAAESGTQKVI